jgi:hypothetical protein
LKKREEKMSREKIFARDINLKEYELTHVGKVKSTRTDAWEMLIPLGKDHVASLWVDDEAIRESGYFKDNETMKNPYPGDSAVHENWEVGVKIANLLRDNENHSLKAVLTFVDAAMGDTVQSRALKQSIKSEFYNLIDRNQQGMYVALGVQSKDTSTARVIYVDKED